ncbi:MAG: hypothetical protein HY961_02575, partial [Ignavibacteriae bacterium]|nr:hypothetical protein [Ignavibacteriota bacterium]
DVEFTKIPKDCLDVLAQQIVAMVSVEEWDVDELFAYIRQSYCYRDLSEKLFLSVVQMLAGRYTNDFFRDLRARISWDKVNNMLRALPGSSQLAITSGGTIADRGYYGVYLEDGKTKVGEVDEEFVYESHTGDTFILGSSVWRMLEIDANKITVVPAPGMPARMPFWRGEGIGRSFELGRKVGEFRKELSRRVDSPDCLRWLQSEFPIDSRAAWNIEQYILKQKQVAGIVPHCELIVIEGFRDEVGDPRIVVHSSFGRQVNGLLGLLVARRLQELTSAEPQMLYNDDGVLLRSSDADELPLNLLDNLTLKEAEDIVLNDLLSSPLFGGQFRMNAARALLMPKVAPGKRTPLWLQRLKAKDLLQVARTYADFPIVIETVRDVLTDVLDFEHFKEVVQGIVSGTIRVKSVQTEVPSPFAASLLFDFIQVYMYEWDEPKSDKLSRYMEVNRELLSEVVDLGSMQEMIRPEAIEHVERQLQHTAEHYKARSPEELLEILLRVGDLSEEEIKERIVDADLSMLEELERNGRARRQHFPSGIRWIAGEEEPLYSHLDLEMNRSAVVRRYIQNHGPITSQELASRYGFRQDAIQEELDRLTSSDDVVKGRFSPRLPSDQQFVFRSNLDHIRRQTISILRKEIKPSSLHTFTQFLFHWQKLHSSTQVTGTTGISEVVEQLQALPLPMEIWEREIFLRRVKDYSRDKLASLTLSGAVVWTGSGNGKLKCLVRGDGAIFLTPTQEDNNKSLSEPSQRLLGYLRKNGASFFTDIRGGCHLSLEAMNNALAELLWQSHITNDQFAELLSVKHAAKRNDEKPIEPIDLITGKRNPYRFKAMQTVRRAMKQVPGWNGRWSLVNLPGVLGDELSIQEQAYAQAQQLLSRYGVLAREFYRREELLPWPLIATELQRMELRGEIRRGYFVEGLSGMQFALPAAVEELHRIRIDEVDEAPMILNASDPANPYGGGIVLNASEPAPMRIPSNYFIFHRGLPLMIIENYGGRLRLLGNPPLDMIKSALATFTAMLKLPDQLRPFTEIVVNYCNDARPTQSPLAPILASLGFRKDKDQTMRYDGW